MRKGKRTLKGLETVMENLNREVQKIEGRTAEGMIQAAIIVARDMETVPPKIPVDEGNLRASRFIVSGKGEEQVPGQSKGSFRGEDGSTMQSNHSTIVSKARAVITASRYPQVIIGFSANYARWVHEMDASIATTPKSKGRKARKTERGFTRVGSGPKFFEAHWRNNEANIVRTIAKYAKIE